MCELMTSTLTSIRSGLARTGQPSPTIGGTDYALVLLSAGGCHSSASRSSVRIQDMTPALPPRPRFTPLSRQPLLPSLLHPPSHEELLHPSTGDTTS